MAEPTAEAATAERTLVQYEVRDGVAYLSLSDPPANTYTHEMMRQLDDAILKARFLLGVTGACSTCAVVLCSPCSNGRRGIPYLRLRRPQGLW